MSKLEELQKLGQSIWYDNIRRALIDSGELQLLLEGGVTGVTSNPSIFEKAIAGSADYDTAIQKLADSDCSDEEIFESLALDDIRRTADLLRPIYEHSGRDDGYVSLEVSPKLADDTASTVGAARRLFEALGRPNVMIKVPATAAGIPAIEQLISEGINVNVTLIFAPETYESVADAYVVGLERLVESGGDPGTVRSVASFFVSRVDSAVDEVLETYHETELEGRIAIANSRVAYARYLEIVRGSRWHRLEAAGARPQRLLWASTGTKNPAYPDTMYVDSLIGADTVNTVPPATLDRFLDHGTVAETLGQGLEEARADLVRLRELGIDLKAITDRLQEDGVASFAGAFDTLLQSVAEKRRALRDGTVRIAAELGSHRDAVDAALEGVRADNVLRRIWSHDHTVWNVDPEGIDDRLGWLHSPENMTGRIGPLRRFVDKVRVDGFTHVVVLGMGGSSLAPEGFEKMFRKNSAVSRAHLDLTVIDTTDPDAIRARSASLEMNKTLFIVATKSGGTTETLSAFRYFFNRVLARVGPDEAGCHFVAITDPGSHLVEIAEAHGFRHVFLNDPNIGGRYAALSYFGLVPAALVGVDLEELLDRARTAACNAASANCPVEGDNDASGLGTILGTLALAGRDKLTISSSPEIASFGDWVEQLIAESTGKNGSGIVPVVGEQFGPPTVYGDDRLFVDLSLPDDDDRRSALDALEAAGHPVIRIRLREFYDIGSQFFVWEMATAIAGHLLGIQPFDQPNVEAAKILARKMVAEYAERGELPNGATALVTSEALFEFLDQAAEADYVSLQAYVKPTEATDQVLGELRRAIRKRYRLATTSGYGPRFLHSTGQLHKGDRGNGLFVQFTSDAKQDIGIPKATGSDDALMSFQVLKMAQALGDAAALREGGRRVLTFHLGHDPSAGLLRLLEAGN